MLNLFSCLLFCYNIQSFSVKYARAFGECHSDINFIDLDCSDAGYAAISVVDFQNSPGEHAPGPS